MHSTGVAKFSDRLTPWICRLAVLVLLGLPLAVFIGEAVKGLTAAGSVEPAGILAWRLLARSVLFAFAAATLCVAVGVPAGLTAGRLSRGVSAVAVFLFLAPLALPPAIHAYIWRNVALRLGLLGLLFVEGGSPAVNFAGAVWSLASAFWTITALAVYLVAAGAGRRFEMEARVFAPPGLAARKILLPMIRPAAIAAAGLTFILAFCEYGAPALWQLRTFPEHLLSLYSSLNELPTAAAAGLVPAAVALSLAALVYPAAGRAIRRLDVERASVDARVLWRPGWLLRTLLFATIGTLVGVPVAVAGWHIFEGGLDTQVLRPVFANLTRTILIAALSASLAGVLAGVVAAAHPTGSKAWRNALVLLAVAGFLVPATGLGLAVITISRWSFVPEALSRTGAFWVYGLSGRLLAVPLLFVVVAFSGLGRRYENLVRISGASHWRRTWRIALPLAAPAVLAAAAVAAVLGVGELVLGSLLAPAGMQPISVNLFNLMHYAHQREAFAAGLAMMFGGAAAVFVIVAVLRRLWKRYLPAT